VFHEIKYFEEDHYGNYGAEFFDGVLGLTVEKPWPPRLNNILPSPFRSMIDHNLLDTNMFSIIWPTETRGQGSLIFGGYDEDLLDGELVSHPLYPEDTTSWQIEIEGVTMTNSTGGKEVLVDKPLPHATALFMSFPPILAFSWPLAESLMQHFENWPSACTRFRVVNCTDVPSFPEITIRLKGQNVTLSGEDYVRRLELPGHCANFGVDECDLMFDYLGDMEDMVILGMPFLEKVMGVWNWDDKTVSCEFFSALVERVGCVNLCVVGNLKD
jgi:saccharopepsin